MKNKHSVELTTLISLSCEHIYIFSPWVILKLVFVPHRLPSLKFGRSGMKRKLRQMEPQFWKRMDVRIFSPDPSVFKETLKICF